MAVFRWSKHQIFMLAITKAELNRWMLRRSWFRSTPIGSELMLNWAETMVKLLA